MPFAPPLRADSLARKGALHLVGVEKTGDFASFLKEYRQAIEERGDFFLPSVRFVVEEVTGSVMSSGYRNRVSYGAKVVTPVEP